MFLLHIETATPMCSVAISQDDQLLAYRDLDEANVHASKLTLFIQELLVETRLTMQQLDAVTVSKGPGSYTGLRIGVSVAKGLCYALDIPLVAVNTLDALTSGFLSQREAANESNSLFCPMLDARRMEVYTAVYRYNGEQLEPTKALIIDEHTFDTKIEEGKALVLFGEGANKLADLFDDNPYIQVVPDFKNTARYLIEPAWYRLQQQNVENVAYFEPFYLKDFVPTTPKK